MKYETVYDLFDAMGYIDGTTVPCSKWRHESLYATVHRNTPDDFRAFYDSSCVTMDYKFIYEDIEYNENTLLITVIRVTYEGEEYFIKFIGNYSSWSDTEYYRDPVFCKPVEVTRIEYQTI